MGYTCSQHNLQIILIFVSDRVCFFAIFILHNIFKVRVELRMEQKKEKKTKC